MPSTDSPNLQASPRETKDRLPIVHESNRRVLALVLFGIGCFEAFVRYLRIRTGQASVHSDVRTTWLPIADETLSGTPPYLTTPVDNKPPLFEYLNVAVGATDQYLGVFLLLVGLANGTVAYLLWRAYAERGRGTAGYAGALLFLVSVPLLSGHAVNVRSFTLVGVLLAVHWKRSVCCGLAVAAAGLLSQYAVFAVPGVVYARLRSTPADDRLRWVGRFVAAAGAVVAAGYLSVYLFWGEPSFAASVRWSVWSAERYVLDWTPSAWNGTETWLALHARTGPRLLHLLVPAALGGVVALRERWRGGASSCLLERRAVAFAVLLGIPLLVRPFRTYWLYPLPWLSSLAVFGLDAATLRIRRAGE